MLGIPPGETAIDWNQVIFKGLVIKGIYGREMFETWYKMSSMLQSGLDVRPVITHRLGINDYQRGLRDHEFRQVRQDHPGLVQPLSLRRCASQRPASSLRAVSARLAAPAIGVQPVAGR